MCAKTSAVRVVRAKSTTTATKKEEKRRKIKVPLNIAQCAIRSFSEVLRAETIVERSRG